jgi:hypothetical protein
MEHITPVALDAIIATSAAAVAPKLRDASQWTSVAAVPKTAPVQQFDADAFRRQNLNHLLEDEAASIMGTTVKTLRNWRSLRVGPSWTKVGRTVMYPISGIESYLEGHLNATTREERAVGVSVYHQRPTPGHKPDRIGGHRTKQEKSRAA